MAVLQVFVLQIILLFCVWPIQAASSSSSSGHDLCPKRCGNARFVYPFGIGEGCYLDKSFEVTCNSPSGYPKAYLPSINNLELLSVSSYGTMRVNVPVMSSEATTITPKAGVNLSGTPFTFSVTANRFMAIGCNEYGTISSIRQGNFASNVSGACLSVCTCDPTSNDSCYDFLCSLSRNITQVFTANTASLYSPNVSKKCQSVSIAEKDWMGSEYVANPTVLRNQARQIPAVLKWGEETGHCYADFSSLSEAVFCDEKRNCLIRISSSSVCKCSGFFETNGRGYCSGIAICINGNNCSRCPYDSNPSGSGTCNKYDPLVSVNRQSRVKFTLIGCGAGFGLLILLIGVWLLYKFVKRRRDIKLKEKFFKRNGGFLLQQELSSNDRSIEKTKLFTSKDLEKATDNYNSNLILGQGGQGTVYKGMLTDGRIVAVKKSKQVNESNVGQFINEVVILSQINHRNIVQLLGCCLETEVPMLVYEFVLNGTLYQYIHDQIEEFSITWEMLLRIAAEVSDALFYLHYAASIPIYHRDIKSANILLDEKYRAKVSDFGTSRSVPVDQTHLTTKVQGTFGYFDPEYFQSSQFTEKSDVYSFGVVLVEILTRQKPIRAINGEENRSLVGYFLQAMNENRLFEVIDTRVLKEAQKEEIMNVATLSKRCLNLNGKMRPTMKEVAFELGMVRASREAPILQQNFEENDSFVDCDVAGHYFNETGSSCTETSMPNSIAAFSVDADPLLSKQCG